MIRIQKLRQPKRISGEKLVPGGSMTLKGVKITNGSKFVLFVDGYERKPVPPKASRKDDL